MKFVTAYDKTNQVRPVYEPERDPDTGMPISRTTQDDVKACNINNIMKKYIKEGVITHVNKHQGHYGDATQTEYLDAFELVQTTDALFSELPARVREQFDNDPAKFLGQVENLTADDIRKLLTPATEDPPPTPPVAENPPTEPPATAPAGNPAPANSAPTG